MDGRLLSADDVTPTLQTVKHFVAFRHSATLTRNQARDHGLVLELSMCMEDVQSASQAPPATHLLV